jgi:hypothetical protein
MRACLAVFREVMILGQNRVLLLSAFTAGCLAVSDALPLFRADGYDGPALACMLQDKVADAGELGIPVLVLRASGDFLLDWRL